MKVTFHLFACCLVAAFLMSSIGCNSETDSGGSETPSGTETPDEHAEEGGHHHAETLAAAAKELAEHREAVSTALAADDYKAADTAIHEFGHVLAGIDGMLDKENPSEEARTAIMAAAASLGELRDSLDEQIHEGKADFSAVAEELDAAIKALADNAPKGEAAHEDHEEGEEHK